MMAPCHFIGIRLPEKQSFPLLELRESQKTIDNIRAHMGYYSSPFRDTYFNITGKAITCQAIPFELLQQYAAIFVGRYCDVERSELIFITQTYMETPHALQHRAGKRCPNFIKVQIKLGLYYDALPYPVLLAEQKDSDPIPSAVETC